MNTKYLVIPVIIIADIATKNWTNYDALGVQNHYGAINKWSILFLIPMILLAAIRPQYRVYLGICIAGGILNYLDSLDGVVINPFITIPWDYAIGFNIADIAILYGAIGAIVIAIKEKRQKRKIGSVEWNNV